MKTNSENECFFSIKLQNGFIITGTNPQEVQNFILDLHLACQDSMYWTTQESEDDMSAWVDSMSDYKNMFHDAWLTIEKHLKKREEE